MRRTIYLPDELARRVDEYLRFHPETTLSAIVQEALERQILAPRPEAILELAGLVKHTSRRVAERPDHYLDRPEDLIERP
jgi:hypothetical protein